MRFSLSHQKNISRILGVKAVVDGSRGLTLLWEYVDHSGSFVLGVNEFNNLVTVHVANSLSSISADLRMNAKSIRARSSDTWVEFKDDEHVLSVGRGYIKMEPIGAS